MKETRTVTLLVEKEIEVEMDSSLYEVQRVWDKDHYTYDYLIDEDEVEKAIREEIPTEIDGWRVLKTSNIER